MLFFNLLLFFFLLFLLLLLGFFELFSKRLLLFLLLIILALVFKNKSRGNLFNLFDSLFLLNKCNFSLIEFCFKFFTKLLLFLFLLVVLQYFTPFIDEIELLFVLLTVEL